MYERQYHALLSRREICFQQLQNLTDLRHLHSSYNWVSQEPSTAEHSTTALLNTAVPAQHSTHTEAAMCFSHDKANTQIWEFPSHVTSMRGSAGCQNMIRHLSSILLLLKAETQGTIFFLSCDSHPRILLLSEWKLLARKLNSKGSALSLWQSPQSLQDLAPNCWRFRVWSSGLICLGLKYLPFLNPLKMD